MIETAVPVARASERVTPHIAAVVATKTHGTRTRYVAGCRCNPCRGANTQYENGRRKARLAGDWNGLVSAEPARRHLRYLQRKGVGYQSVSAASDIGATNVLAIRIGKCVRIHARTERRLLAVTPDMLGDRALVPAGRLWRRIAQLLEEGFTKAALARQLGRAKPALVFGRVRVTARSDADVERLWRKWNT